MVKLRDYQSGLVDKGISILKEHNIVYLALEMRLGKTFISLFIANHFNPKKVIFVTKKKAIKNIQGDFNETNFSWNLICTNYESLHKIIDADDAEIIIFDEAHRLGGFPMAGKATKQARELAKNKKVIFLSGTPTPETEAQIFYQFWVSSYSPFWQFSFFKWADEYIDVYEEVIKLKDKKTGELKDRVIKKYDKAYKDKIFEVVEKYFVRFSQKDAGFQQKIEERFLFVEMNDLQKQICQSLKSINEYKSPNNWIVKADSGASMQSKFHQIHSGSVILWNEDENAPKKSVIINKAKALLIKEYFKGKKIAIFYKFQAELNIIKSVFDNITYDQFEFNQSTDKVFVGQITSCREGINLATAEHLVFYNISFSALDYWQTINRFQSANRTAECIIYWIFSKDGIEEKIYDAVKKKKDYTLQYFKKDFLVKKQLTIF